jgi:hypothetical protein
MASSNFDFSASIPEPVRILGLALLPLSLGRYRLLKRLGCAFVSDPPLPVPKEPVAQMEFLLGHLLIGALICSMRCAEGLEFLESPKAARELKRWGKRIRREARRDRYFSIYDKAGLFRQYLDVAHEVPWYWNLEDTGPASGADWTVTLENMLRSDLGYTREEIEEAPLKKALEDAYKRMERMGAIQLMTPAEIEQVKAGLESNRSAVISEQSPAAQPSTLNPQPL